MNGLNETPVDLLGAVRLSGLLSALAVLAGTWFLVRLVTGALERLGNRFTDKRLLFHQIATLSRFALYLLSAGIAVALSITLSREVVLALTGTAAVAIGLALKDLTASVLAGIIIIIDQPFQVGDRVTFQGVYGEITAIGLRSVRLTTLDDNLVTIPNNKFLTDVVSSGNAGNLDMLIQLDFVIGGDQDVALAKRLVEEALVTNRYVYVRKPWVVLVDAIVEANYCAVRLRAKAYVLDVKYELEYRTDVTERVLMAFREHGIRTPAVMHRDVSDVPARRAHAA